MVISTVALMQLSLITIKGLKLLAEHANAHKGDVPEEIDIEDFHVTTTMQKFVDRLQKEH